MALLHRMNDVKERLERLDEEASALAAKVKDAWKVYRSTKDPEDKQRYEDLKEKEKQLLPLLLEERRALQAKLPGAGAGSKKPTLLQNVTIIYDSGTDAETFRKYTTTSQGNLVKALEQGGIDGVRLFNSDSVVTPWDMVYQSNSSYIADSARDTLNAKSNGMLGFQSNVARSLELLAKDSLMEEMLQRHPEAKLLETNIIKADDGSERDADAAGYATSCSYVAEAKVTPTPENVDQLRELIDFIQEKTLLGDAANLKKDNIVGVMVGASSPRKKSAVECLMKRCAENNFILKLPSGRSVRNDHHAIRRMAHQRPVSFRGGYVMRPVLL